MMANWAIAFEQAAQAGAGQSGVVSYAGTMVGDMCFMQVALGDNANQLHTAADFGRSLNSMAEDSKIVSFFADEETLRNAEGLERALKETLLKPAQITSALTIPTATGAAIERLKNTQTTPSTSLATCALSLNDELIRTLKAMAQTMPSYPSTFSRFREGGKTVVRRASHSGTKGVGF